MKCVLYSGGEYLQNLSLHRELLWLSDVEKPRITYIPSSNEYGLADFPDFVRSFKPLSECEFVYFPIDMEYSQRLETEALKSEIIFLSGGNTFYFLRNLRQKKLLTKIKGCAKNGATLGGLSAGAIIMTPNINTASFPAWDRDDNFVNLKKFEAMKLFNCEFFPHYSNSQRYRTALCNYSKRTKHNLVAAADGSGMIRDHDKTTFVGKCFSFHKGHLHKYNR